MESDWSEMLSKSIVLLLRNGFAISLVIFLIFPCFVSAENVQITNVKRLIKFDFNAQSFGCKGVAEHATSMEVSSGIFNQNTRKNEVFIGRFENITTGRFTEMVNSKIGAILLMLPKSLKDLSQDLQENLLMLEKAILFEDININTYFAKYSEELEKIIEETGTSDTSRRSIMSQIASAKDQKIVEIRSGLQPQKNPSLSVISGELPFPNKNQNNANTPIIVITTQIKNFGIFDEIAPNHDVTLLLGLMDAFSKLYSSMPSPKYRIVFLVSEGAYLLNFHGVKKWLDHTSELNNYQIEFAINIDGFSEPSDTLYMHVSKPPSANALSKFLEVLKKKSEVFGEKQSKVVHKKINLADQFLKYAHEKFSLKKINAFTLSSLESYENELRTSIFSPHADQAVLTSDSVLSKNLLSSQLRNTKILAESLADFVFALDGDQEIFSGPLSLTLGETILPFSYAATTSLKRSHNLKLAFEKHLRNVKVLEVKPDKIDEFMLYEEKEAKLSIYSVKPAIFDLFMTIVVGMYLFGAYFIITYYKSLYAFVCNFHPARNENNSQ